MEPFIKFNQLSWKMRVAIFISVLWFLFWLVGGWEEEEILLGLAFGGIPIILFWGFWMVTIPSRKDKDSSLAKNILEIKDVGIKERREFARLEYPPTKRPLLKYGEHELQIINISEKGIKLLNDKKIELSPSIRGEAIMLSGKSITVDGEVSWSLSNEFGMHMTPIPRSIITEERRILSEA